jgi:hypothetical protein
MSTYSGYSTFTREDYEADHLKKKKLESRVAWYNPKEDAIYLSDNDKNPNYPDGMKIVPSVANVTKAKELKAAGKMNSDEAKFSIYNKQDGWADIANDYYSDRIKARQAGVMAPQDYTGVEVTNVLSTLLGLPERNFVLQNAALTVPTPYLDVRADTWSGFDVAEDIKIGAEIPTGQGTFTSTTYTLKLNAAHIARYDELDARPHYWDIWRTNLENIARRMVKKKAQLIGTELETATGVTGTDWGATTAGLSTANPLDQIGGVSDTIVGNDGVPDSIAIHDRGFRDLITNTFIHGTSQNAPPQQQPGQAKILTVPGLSFTFYVDNLVTSTVATVYDKNAIVAFQGPVSTAMYRDAIHRYDGYITTDYFLTKITQQGKIRKLTAISAP